MIPGFCLPRGRGEGPRQSFSHQRFHMKKPNITHLSSLAVLPCLLSVATEVSAAVQCSPSAMVSGDMVALQGNCLDTDTGLSLASGSEVWNRSAGGALGSRSIPSGSLSVPLLPGENTFYISAIDNGYGGMVDLQGEGGYPSVTVNGAGCTTGCTASASELGAPLMTLQTQRLRSNLDHAHARLRALRSQRPLPGFEVQGVPLPEQKPEAKDGAREQRLGVYLLGLGDYLRQNRSDTQGGFKLRSTALSLGADYRLNDQWAMGANVGGSHSTIDFADTASEQRGRGQQATAYASWSFSPSAYLSATLSYETTRYDLQRDDGAGGLALATPQGRGVGLSLSAGRDVTLGAWTLGPYLRYDRISSRVNAYEESGSDAALAVGTQRLRSQSVSLGAQAQLSVPVPWGLLLPYVRAEVTHRRERAKDTPTATLVNGGGAVLIASSADTNASHGNLALGVSGVNQGGMSWFADCETGVAQKGYRTQRIGLGLRFEL